MEDLLPTQQQQLAVSPASSINPQPILLQPPALDSILTLITYTVRYPGLTGTILEAIIEQYILAYLRDNLVPRHVQNHTTASYALKYLGNSTIILISFHLGFNLVL